MVNETFDIQVPQGTIVKVAGHPVKLKQTLYIKQLTENEFGLDDHELMDYIEEDEVELC